MPDLPPPEKEILLQKTTESFNFVPFIEGMVVRRVIILCMLLAGFILTQAAIGKNRPLI
jgi:hypothetical protein